MHPIPLILIGYGNVAKRFVTLLHESEERLTALGVTPVISGVATRRHGTVFDGDGLDLARIDEALSTSSAAVTDRAAFIADACRQLKLAGRPAPVVIEATTLDVKSGEPAISHVRAGLDAGADVITANKGPVAFAYRALAGDATLAKCSFLFEGSVMDGIPIFNLVRETMPAVTIWGFRGVVNSTVNYMLDAMERGESYEAALARMQTAGVAEADPRLDVDGWDAAAKAAALANVWLDADLTPPDVAREGITRETAERARAAVARGHRLKMIASATGRGSATEARVALEELPANDPLAILDGQANALEVNTWPLGRIVITQRDGGMEKTAYALVSDLVKIAQRRQDRAPTR